MIEVDVAGYDVTYLDDYWLGSKRVVLLIEDHEIVRSGLRKLLMDVFVNLDLEVLEARNLAEADRIVSSRKNDLDLVLMDVFLPDGGERETLSLFKRSWSSLPVVVVSASEDWDLIAHFYREGALGFISKSIKIEKMINALRLILAGERYFPNEVFSFVSNENKNNIHLDFDMDTKQILTSEILSPKLREVLALMLQGLANKQIAGKLNISVGTAKNYVAAILKAFNATNRSQAILIALNEMNKKDSK